MTKLLITFITFLLTAPWCFSQERYPQRYQQGTDTLVVITQKQLSGANTIFQKKNLLQKRISLMEDVDSVKDSIINAKVLEISMLRQIGENYRFQIDKMRQLQDYDAVRYEQDKRRLRRTCWVVGGVCISVGITAGILIMALK